MVKWHNSGIISNNIDPSPQVWNISMGIFTLYKYSIRKVIMYDCHLDTQSGGLGPFKGCYSVTSTERSFSPRSVENFAPFTRVSRSTKATLRQSVESIVFNHLAHLYSLVTAVVQELLSQTWKRTLDFILVYIRYDWLLLGDNQKKVNQFLQLKCSLSHKIQT